MRDLTNLPNSLAAIRERIARGRIRWHWPLLMAFIRLPLIVAGMAAAYGTNRATGVEEPFLSALMIAPLATVVANLVSLALLQRLTRREGIRLRDLVGFDRSSLWRDVALGLALLVVLNVPFLATVTLVAFLLGGSMGGQDLGITMASIFTGPLADANVTGGVPALIGVILFPLVNPIVEEMHYRGYVQPRLEALSGTGPIAICVTAAGFALQHVTYALTLPGLGVFLTAYFVWGIGAGIVYARMRRLTSLIVAHFVTNASTASIPLVFMLAGG